MKAIVKKKTAPARTPARRSRAGATRSLALRDGGHVSLGASAAGETLQVVAAGGEVRLEIVFTPSGPVVRLAGARVGIETEGALAFRCASFEVTAETIALGATGNVNIRAGHDASVSAQAVKIEGRRGEVAIAATDDLTLNGERVLMNCPTDEEAERQRLDAASLAQLLELPFQTGGGPRRLPASAPVVEAPLVEAKP